MSTLFLKQFVVSENKCVDVFVSKRGKIMIKFNSLKPTTEKNLKRIITLGNEDLLKIKVEIPSILDFMDSPSLEKENHFILMHHDDEKGVHKGQTRFSLALFQNFPYLNIRYWFFNENGNLQATKSGIALNALETMIFLRSLDEMISYSEYLSTFNTYLENIYDTLLKAFYFLCLKNFDSAKSRNLLDLSTFVKMYYADISMQLSPKEIASACKTDLKNEDVVNIINLIIKNDQGTLTYDIGSLYMKELLNGFKMERAHKAALAEHTVQAPAEGKST